jgi:hypothetical protein
MRNRRYQECNILEKTWRRRHYLKIPFKWIWWKIKSNEGFTSGGYWKILVGTAQMDMKWYYTQEEVMEMFKEKLDKNNIEQDEDTLHS